MARPFSNVPSVDLNNYVIDPEAVKSIPEALARKHRLIPLFRVKESLTVAMEDPSDLVAVDEAGAVSECEIMAVKAEKDSILKAIDQYYNVSNSIEEIIRSLQKSGIEFISEDKLDLVKLQRVTEEPPVIKLVNLILAQAVKDGASDIHIEPEEEEVKVRFRIDGILHTLVTCPRSMALPIVPRIKVVAGLNITERRVPQDGRFRVRVGEKEFDLRISSFPVAFGEKVVIRILDRITGFMSLDKLGFSPKDLAGFEALIRRPYGILLVTGPTGSGKTSTLYSALTALNSAEKNIVTLEEPREYLLRGINQGEINSEIGFTFANGLRAILRQDPDIIMVGEIRDTDTALIAVRAALTGHLVLSTLHTNDSAGAISRLIDMGVEPYLISSSLAGVLAQRLVRTICPQCREQYTAPDEIYEKIGLAGGERPPLWRGRGCLYCRHTGFRGRCGIFELLTVDEVFRKLIAGKASVSEMRQAALRNGMRTLYQDGLEKVLRGLTTLEEVLRVAYE